MSGKYPKDGEKIGCWVCEVEGMEHSESTTLFSVRVFESDRFLCDAHLLDYLIKGMAQRIHENPSGVIDLLKRRKKRG